VWWEILKGYTDRKVLELTKVNRFERSEILGGKRGRKLLLVREVGKLETLGGAEILGV
jgi:hypothetical protein